MPALIDQGYIYIAHPPLYRLGKGKEEFSPFNEVEREDYTKRLGGNGVYIQRYKGLGEMNKAQLWKATMDPNVRTCG